MSKLSELSQMLDELAACGEELVAVAKTLSACGEKMTKTANSIRAAFTDTAAESPKNVPVPAEPVKEEKEPEKPTYSFTDVRKAFSAKSHAGFTEEVKALIGKYGASKLSAINEEDYPALMAELEVIG